MKAINCIFRETIKEGKFEMKSHILVFLDDNGTEQSARKNKYQVIDAVQEMPTFEGFIFSYYSQRLDGTQFPVDVEDMYINCDEWEEFYNETIVKVAQAIWRPNKSKKRKLVIHHIKKKS